MRKRLEKRPCGPLIEDLEGRTLLSATLSAGEPIGVSAAWSPYAVVTSMPEIGQTGPAGTDLGEGPRIWELATVAPVTSFPVGPNANGVVPPLSLVLAPSGAEGRAGGFGGQEVLVSWTGSVVAAIAAGWYQGPAGPVEIFGLDAGGEAAGWGAATFTVISTEGSGTAASVDNDSAGAMPMVPVLGSGGASGGLSGSLGTSGVTAAAAGRGSTGLAESGALNVSGDAVGAVPERPAPVLGDPLNAGGGGQFEGVPALDPQPEDGPMPGGVEDGGPAGGDPREGGGSIGPSGLTVSVGRGGPSGNPVLFPPLAFAGAFIEANSGLTPAPSTDDSTSGLIQGKGLLDYVAGGRELEGVGASAVPITMLSTGMDSSLVREATLGDLSTVSGRLGAGAGDRGFGILGRVSGAAVDEILANAIGLEPASDAEELTQSMGADLIGGLLPVQAESLRWVVDQFVSELQELQAGDAMLSRPRNLVALTSVAVGTLAAVELARRKLRSRPRAGIRTGGPSGSSGSETIGFPELPGSWSTRYS